VYNPLKRPESDISIGRSREEKYPIADDEVDFCQAVRGISASSEELISVCFRGTGI
jgi:hypothetical protein